MLDNLKLFAARTIAWSLVAWLVYCAIYWFVVVTYTPVLWLVEFLKAVW